MLSRKIIRDLVKETDFEAKTGGQTDRKIFDTINVGVRIFWYSYIYISFSLCL